MRSDCLFQIVGIYLQDNDERKQTQHRLRVSLDRLYDISNEDFPVMSLILSCASDAAE